MQIPEKTLSPECLPSASRPLFIGKNCEDKWQDYWLGFFLGGVKSSSDSSCFLFGWEKCNQTFLVLKLFPLLEKPHKKIPYMTIITKECRASNLKRWHGEMISKFIFLLSSFKEYNKKMKKQRFGPTYLPYVGIWERLQIVKYYTHNADKWEYCIQRCDHKLVRLQI